MTNRNNTIRQLQSLLCYTLANEKVIADNLAHARNEADKAIQIEMNLRQQLRDNKKAARRLRVAIKAREAELNARELARKLKAGVKIPTVSVKW